jgi:hypothetical protein
MQLPAATPSAAGFRRGHVLALCLAGANSPAADEVAEACVRNRATNLRRRLAQRMPERADPSCPSRPAGSVPSNSAEMTFSCTGASIVADQLRQHA